MTIRYFSQQDERVETGPIAFGNDWPGVFIRGDNAFAYAMAIEAILRHIGTFGPETTLPALELHGLQRVLESCNLCISTDAARQAINEGGGDE